MPILYDFASPQSTAAIMSPHVPSIHHPQSKRLLRSLNKLRITNNLAHTSLRRAQKLPRSIPTIGKSSINILTALRSNLVILLVQNLAVQRLVLDILAQRKFERGERAVGTLWMLDLADFAGLEELGRGDEVAVAQGDEDGVVFLGWWRGCDAFDEVGVAGDFADLRSAVAESPGSCVAVGDGGVDVCAAHDDDGVVVGVEDLAAEGLVLDVVAEGEGYFVEGAGGADWGFGLWELGFFECGLGGEAAGCEGDADGGVLDGGVELGEGEGAGGGERGEEDGWVLHFCWV